MQQNKSSESRPYFQILPASQQNSTFSSPFHTCRLAFEVQKSKGAKETVLITFVCIQMGTDERSAGCRVGRIWTSLWIVCWRAVLTWQRATIPTMLASMTPVWWLRGGVPSLTLHQMGQSSEVVPQSMASVDLWSDARLRGLVPAGRGNVPAEWDQITIWN